MSEPQDVEQNDQTLEDSKDALDFYDDREEEDRLDSLDGQGDSDEEDDSGEDGKDTETAELEGKLQEMEELLRPYGGAEGAAKALEIVKNSPEYQAVTDRLIKGGGVKEEEEEEKDDPDLDPATKKAQDFVDKRIQKLLGKSLKQVEEKIDSRIKPLSDNFRQTKLETINGRMESSYGKELYKSVEKDMDKVLAEYPANYLDNPSLKKVEDVFHTALRRAGKAEKFYRQQSQNKINGKKEKSTGSPGTGGNSEDKLELREVKSITDALYNAELKAKHGATNRENARSRVSGKRSNRN